MNIVADLDLPSLVTLVIFFAIAIAGPIWVVRVIVRAERKATKRDIENAFEGLTKRMRSAEPSGK